MFGANRRSLCGYVLAALVTACGSESPTSPPPPGDGIPTLSDLRIVGASRALSSGTTVQLKAEASLSSGGRKECRAAWSSNKPEVASINADGVVSALTGGYANITASCTGVAATVEAKVEAPNSYDWDIPVRDAEWGGIVWQVTMEYLDGPRQGEKVPFESELYVRSPVWPVKVRFTSNDYQPLDFVLTESAGELFPGAVLFGIRMAFAPRPDTDTYTGALSPSINTASHAFTLRAPGTVRLRSWWHADDDVATPVMELWCGGRRISREIAPSRGGEIVQAVASSGACEVKMSVSSTNLDYRVAITYPH
jgi:hypothetical protein